MRDWQEVLDAMKAAGVAEISVAGAHAAHGAGTAHLIDVREDREWVSEHIPQTQHCGRGVLESAVATQYRDADTPLLLICHSGRRSVAGAASLMSLGYTNVRSVAGGIVAWKAAGYPTVRGSGHAVA